MLLSCDSRRAGRFFRQLAAADWFARRGVAHNAPVRWVVHRPLREPPVMDPNPYRAPAGPAAASPAPRPASLIVFGILNILFGALGLCGTAGSAAMFFMDLPRDPTIPNPMLDLLASNAAFRLFMQVTVALGALAALVLLVAGVGLLLTKDWGRTLSVGYAWYAIVAGVVGMLVNWVYVIQPMLGAMKEAQGPAAMAAVGGVVGGLIGGLVSLAYPIVLLVFMRRPAVRAALAPPDAA
jgi:hypothetical protein